MKYRLFLAVEALELVEQLPIRIRKNLRTIVSEIGADPMGMSEATDYHMIGRLVQIAIVGDYAITYWIDDADQHIKILDIHSADQ